MSNIKIDPDGMYYRLRFSVKIDGCSSVAGLAERGCPKCGRKFTVEASTMFGSLHCAEHGVVWQWIPSMRERPGYASRAWKNYVTGKRSKEWKKRFPEGR